MTPRQSTRRASSVAHNNTSNSNTNRLVVTTLLSWTHWLAAMSAIALTLSPSATTANSRPAAFIGVPARVAAPFVAHRSFRDPPAAAGGTKDVLVVQLPSHQDNDPDRRNRMSLRSLSASGASEYDDTDDTDTDASPFEQSRPPPPTSNLSFPQMVVTDRPPLETMISSTIPPATAVPPPLLGTPENDDNNKYIEPVVVTKTSNTATVPRASLRTKLGLSVVKRTNEKEEATSSRLPRNSSNITKVVGHRGALYEFLENTREGFVHCAQMGCHAIELDVFFLPRDGSVVVFHGTDDDEHRPGLLRHYCLGYEEEEEDDNASTRQHCSIVDLTYAEAQLLQFNPDFAEFGCDRRAVEQGRIPLLEDVLQDLRAFPDLEIKIELKGHGTVQPVLDIVERWQMQRQCSYSSFDLQQLQQLRQLRPDTTLYRTGALFAGVPPTNWLALARDCGATEIHLQYDECTTARMAAVHQAGFGSMAWFRGPRGMQSDAVHKYSDDMHTGEDERCYTTVLETGVQQVCCNRPNVLLRLLTELQQEQQQTWTVG